MTIRLAAAVVAQVIHLQRFLEAQADESGAKWNQLFPLGETYARPDFGEVTFSREWLSTMLSNWQAAGEPKLSTDYFHFGDSDPDVVQPFENKLASGDIVALELRADGLYGLIEWTEKARTCILRRELKCISPSFQINGTNRHTGEKQGPTLLGAALLNDPFLQELPQVAASNTRKEKTTMDHATACTIFGLNPDQTSPEQLKAHMAKCGAAYTAHGDTPAPGNDGDADDMKKAAAQAEEKVKLARAEATKLAAENKKLEGEKTELAGRVGKLEEERQAEKVTALNKKLLDGGFITAAQQEGVAKFAKAFGLEETEKHYSAGGPKVKLSEAGITGTTPEERSQHSGDAAKVEFTALMDAYQQNDKLSPDKALTKLKREHPEVWKAAYSATPSKRPAA